MISAHGYAAHAADKPLTPFAFERREPGPRDVQMSVLYCGICHSDLHQVRGDWEPMIPSLYPMVPGHEIVGRVTKVGARVAKFKIGDTVGVGCMVNSCRTCPACRNGLEQYCESGATMTYNGRERDSGDPTFGGYSDVLVTNEDFVVRIPDNLDLKAVAPLLCAGITTYSPLRHWKAGPGVRVGIIGLGGLGHMGIKFARAFGAEVTLLTTSPSKVHDAERLGAHATLVTRDAAVFTKNAGKFDLLFNTIPTGHDVNPYLQLLAQDGVMILVGALTALTPPPLGANLLFNRRSLVGSIIGGIRETQEMLDFCGAHTIMCDVEVIPLQNVNAAFERLAKGDVHYRFVIDMESLRRESARAA